MSNAEIVTAWVEAYQKAWESNDPADIRAAFTDDAVYFRAPGGPPWTGIDAIVAGWQENRDEPGDVRFEWSIAAIDGDVAVLRAKTDYPDHAYDNAWIVRLAPDGRASEYTDFWVVRQ
jgi:uncharacterized protein (TIGR02246 family)